MLLYDIKENDVEFQLCYYVHFRIKTPGKGMNLPILQLWVK